jgi:hypothetical protein
VGTALLCPALGDAGQAGLDTIVLMLPLVTLHSSAATLASSLAHHQHGGPLRFVCHVVANEYSSSSSSSTGSNALLLYSWTSTWRRPPPRSNVW